MYEGRVKQNILISGKEEYAENIVKHCLLVILFIYIILFLYTTTWSNRLIIRLTDGNHWLKRFSILHIGQTRSQNF